MQKSLTVLFVFACALLSACGAISESGKTSATGTDSLTEFLACSADDQCPELGQSCHCGTCTRECATVTDCGGELARCHIATSVCGEITIQSGTAGLCTAACKADSDCANSGTLTRCEAQRCVAPTRAPTSSGATTPEPEAPSACEGEAQSCEDFTCEPGFEREETSPGCCRCAPMSADPCATGLPLGGNPEHLASLLSERLLAASVTDEFTARVGSLEHTGELRCFVEDLMQQPVAQHAVRAFFHSWLSLGQLETRQQLTSDVRATLVESSLFYGVDMMTSGAGLAELLTSREIWTSRNLFDIYPSPVPGDILPITLADEYRSGILTQAGFLVAHNPSEDITRPVLRGIAVREGLLCDKLPSPPPNVDNVLPEPPARPFTGRERFETHSEDPACVGCHALIDPFGFALENFDQLGRHREQDNGLPIDASLRVISTDFDGNYAGPREFFAAAAQSADVRSCFAIRWGNYLATGDAFGDNLVITSEVGQGARNAQAPSLAALVGIAASSHPFLSWAAAGALVDSNGAPLPPPWPASPPAAPRASRIPEPVGIVPTPEPFSLILEPLPPTAPTPPEEPSAPSADGGAAPGSVDAGAR